MLPLRASGGDDGLHTLWAVVDGLCTAAMLAAAPAAVAGWRPAAWILAGVVAAFVASHVVISTVAFRRTMRRPWPRVEPVPDDDW